MKRQWIGVFAAAVVATTALGAQDKPANAPPDPAAPPAAQRQVPAVPAPAAPKADTVTISGCIQDTPMVTAAARPAEAAGATKSFYLNNVVTADAGRDRGAAIGTAGLAATGYRLDGDDKMISPHLNHQVRIVGTVQGSSTAGPLLKVDSVTMVSAKCEQTPAAAKP